MAQNGIGFGGSFEIGTRPRHRALELGGNGSAGVVVGCDCWHMATAATCHSFAIVRPLRSASAIAYCRSSISCSLQSEGSLRQRRVSIATKYLEIGSKSLISLVSAEGLEPS